uniref:EF-hand domain-containing protein n=1 Tax=Neobodo designis TaxID=312471 RepID=A0A7S1M4H7_NEODS|mmetsp:Transcript_34051/g.105153  ORF Transcript_34051/g.105153 Transcript_34051/m.105153 type:complete len:316 (+) Transcript_34051:176-1123(+)
MAAQKSELNFEEILTARTVFAKHADGKVKSVHQLRSILSDLGQYPSQAELDAVLECFGNKLRFEDFARYLEFLKRSFLKPEAKDADTVRAFVALGGSHDRHGNIIADDLRSACRKFNLTIDIDKMLQEVDEDGSGAIDYSEFRAMWESADQNNVSFQMEEESQSETEYLNMLRSYLTAERKDPESTATFHRTASKVRKQSTRNLHDSARKSMIRLPPVNTQATTASPAKNDQSQGSDSDEEDVPAKTVAEPQRIGNVNDPAYRRYMMTDPVVVGSRRGGKPTPRGMPPPLPPVTPRSGRRAGSSVSPRRSMTTTK